MTKAPAAWVRLSRAALSSVLLSGLLPTLLTLAVFAFAAAVSGCARKPKDVRVNPSRSTIYGLKRTFVMSATVTDMKGKQIAGPQLTWETDRPKVATVDVNGVVTAVSPGRTNVVAKFENLSGKASVEVVDAATLTVSPLRMTIAGPPGTTGTFHAEVKSSKGAPVDARPRWTSSDPKVVTVDGNGVAKAVGPGRTTITATLGDIGNSADVTVTARPVAQFEANPRMLILRVGDTQTVTPVALDEAGKEIPDPAVDWVSSDPKTAKVVEGKVTGMAPGTATIRAASGSRTAEVSALVN